MESIRGGRVNHVQRTINGMAAVYQRGQFLPERRAALEVWGKVVSGNKP